MLKKLLTVLGVLFVFTAVWAQNLHFPYIYSNSQGDAFDVYKTCVSGEQITEDFDGDNFVGGYFKANKIHCFVLRYKSSKEDIEKSSVDFLKDYRTVFRQFDAQIDRKERVNLKLFFVFIGSNNIPIAYALYDETINATEESVWNPLNGVKRSINRTLEAYQKKYPSAGLPL